MIEIIPAVKRHLSDMGWLKTYWLFSFGSYYDLGNLHHGSLRVFNDDIVQAQKGFETHPHEEMEIISIVLQGEMEHRDTMGNVSVIKANDVQRMTAGTGLQHSEWNHADSEVRFFQIWILPDKKNLLPSYDQKNFSPASWQNKLVLLAGDKDGNAHVALNSDAMIFRSNLSENRHISYDALKQRKLFLYVISGTALINGKKLGARDQARISEERKITIQANGGVDFILIDVPET